MEPRSSKSIEERYHQSHGHARVIDVHGHLGESALLYLSTMKQFPTPEELIKLMDA